MKNDKLKFRHEHVDNEETKELHRNNPFACLELLTEISAALLAIANRFSEGNVSLFSEVCESLDLWNATNYARLWPEKYHEEIDHLLQDALNRLGDVHFMIESVYYWGPGDDFIRYKRTFPKIANEIRFALDMIKEAIALVDAFIDENLGDKK